MSNDDLSRLKIDRSNTAANAPAHKRRPGFAMILAVIALAGLVAAAYFNHHAAVAVESVSVSTAYPSQSFTLLNATGHVVAQRKAAVASKATGRVEWLGVAEGSRVSTGEVIARLENKDVTATMNQTLANIRVAEANLRQGEAELADAMAALGRHRDLLAKGFISHATYDSVIARHNKAEAGIKGYAAAIDVARANHHAAQVAVEHTLIHAPFDGVVLTKSANVGDVVTPFSSAMDTKGAVVTMADMSTLEVEADVSESSLHKVALEQPCEIELDALPDTRLRGRVHRIVPTVDRAKATILVKVRFVDHDPRVLPEMSAKVAFLEQEMAEGQRTARTVIPVASLTERNGRKIVFMIRDGKAAATPVETGEKIGEMTEIRSGLKPGEKIITKPPETLDDGDRIEIATK